MDLSFGTNEKRPGLDENPDLPIGPIPILIHHMEPYTMIHQNQDPRKDFQSFPVPKGLETAFSGPFADDLAKLSYLLLMFSIPYTDRREKGFYIPFSKATGWRYFNKRWPQVRKASDDYGDVFDWNNRYCSDDLTGFPKSVRLAEPYRTGECIIYTTQKKFSPIRHIDYDRLDEPAKRLIRDFQEFQLPEEMPEFSNPWQALTWDSITKGDFYAKRCEYGRFHSNYTAFKHRYSLQCTQGPLAAIDIKAAQMLCLASVVRRHIGKHPDITRWLAICNEGDIYEFLASKLGKSRAETKDGLIRCVFERTGSMVEMPEFQALEAHFGAIAAAIQDIKETSGYREVARACQRAESTMMIDKAIALIPNVPVVTVHDEFILPAQHLGPAKLAIKKAFRDYGLSPAFKVTELENP